MKLKNLLTYLFCTVLLGVLSFSISGCKKDDTNPCGTKVCQNGGYCQNGSCACPSGFSGPNCEVDNRPSCVKNGTGVITFDNWSKNPYDCYIDGNYKGRVAGYGTRDVTVYSGYYSLKATQASGYALYPSVYTGSGTVSQCGTLKFTFP
ncbi:MAG: calcium-binding EGF-like domain-containing protein [Chitinophagales bacterium]|nr:calcium-binding EGF-like domain-containing protein [Chitinophagales bacterium]